MTLFKSFKNADTQDKKILIKEFLINNSLYIFLIAAVIVIQFLRPHFLSAASIVNIISLSAANLPIALGIAGAIILTGTDLSAGRIVGLVACVCASLLQASGYAGKMFPGLATLPLPVVLLIALAIGALIGLINGFCTAKFSLHPFIVTLSTQLIAYGALLMYLNIGNNNGQSISGLDAKYTDFINGSILSIGKTPIPNYVWYSLLVTAVMWFIWNKTTFGKNMFAVGSNPDAANVSGVNVKRVIMLVFMLLIFRGFWIALHARDRFGALMVVGVMTQISLQTFLNIAVVTGLIPATGISLPFFSYGGTALLIQMAEMGVILSVSRQMKPPKNG